MAHQAELAECPVCGKITAGVTPHMAGKHPEEFDNLQACEHCGVSHNPDNPYAPYCSQRCHSIAGESDE